MAVSTALPEALEEWRDVIHPAALLLPRPTTAEYDDLKASIEDRGVLQPLATFVDAKGDHWLLDGVSRLQIMVELGIPILNDKNEWGVPTTPFREDRGDDPYAIALSLNVSRRHLTTAQKHQLIEDLREQRPDLSDRAIARMAGVSPHTVAAVRHDQEPETDEPDAEMPGGAPDEEEEEIERVEESGRRARGRRPATREEREEREEHRVRELGGGPFIGKVLPTAARSARIAEARRCIRWLGLEPEDVLAKRTVH